jgi:hypothetical protein
MIQQLSGVVVSEFFAAEVYTATVGLRDGGQRLRA